jgi:hypothetical protein
MCAEVNDGRLPLRDNMFHRIHTGEPSSWQLTGTWSNLRPRPPTTFSYTPEPRFGAMGQSSTKNGCGLGKVHSS